jgi:hypothetical protein
MAKTRGNGSKEIERKINKIKITDKKRVRHGTNSKYPNNLIKS